MSALEPGQLFDRYRIESRLGQGGMGEVYRAYDTRLRRHVALKVIRADPGSTGEPTLSDAQRARLLREARAAAGLKHASVVTIFDVGEVERDPYIAMELIDGAPLRSYLRADLPILQKVRWLHDIASALAAAHAAGLVHRDVKPDNVMVCDDGTVKVLDFGIAKVAGTGEEREPSADEPAPSSSLETETGSIVGTPRYMAPEQAAGLAVDARSDQFAWGLTAYETLAGRHPRDTAAGFSRQGGWSEPPRSLASARPEVGEEIARAIMRTLEVRPADRFPSMDEVVAALAVHVPFLPPKRALLTTPTPTAPAAGEETSVGTTMTAPATLGAPRDELPEAPPKRTSRVALGVAAVVVAAGATSLAVWPRAPAPLAQITPSPSVTSAPDLPAPPPSSEAQRIDAASPSASPPAPASADPIDPTVQHVLDGIRKDLPKHRATIKEACGTDVSIDVDWASFGRDKAALQALWGNKGIARIVKAFAVVCVDDENKESVKAKVKRIRASYASDKAKVRMGLGGGTFVTALDWRDNWWPSENDLAAVIFKGL